MNPYPANRSILVMDNCRIHHNIELIDIVNAAGKVRCNFMSLPANEVYSGCLLVYLPPYSPDLNPIEESFSSCKTFFLWTVVYLKSDRL